MLNRVKGLWVPLITPMFHGSYDRQSMRKLMKSIDSYIDGYVPCLSSGEGHILSDKQWRIVAMNVRANTKKPVIAGIKRNEVNSTIRLAAVASKIGLDGVVIPVPYDNDKANLRYFAHLAKKISLPIIIYNTEKNAFKSVDAFKKIDRIEKVVAIKDSSMNMALVKKLIYLRARGQLRVPILQGMEHLLVASKGCDGFLTSLLNVEPKLTRVAFKKPSQKINKEIINKFWEYNLGGDWYISLKSILFARGMIRSAEQVNPSIVP
jgi:4-hydroxy-tetrahydrodipicolinate synthase